jgi:hypothetical protein
MSSETHAARDATYYAYKPSLIGAPSEFQLDADGIEWRRGDRTLRVAYRDIRRVRLAFRPVTMQSHRFLTEFWSSTGVKMTIASTSWRSVMEQERLDADYTAFVTELHRRIAAASGQTIFTSGSPPLLYWPGVAVLAGFMLAAAGLVVHALRMEEWTGAAFVIGMLALFMWQAGNFFRRNRPGIYAPDALPRQVLP